MIKGEVRRRFGWLRIRGPFMHLLIGNVVSPDVVLRLNGIDTERGAYELEPRDNTK